MGRWVVGICFCLLFVIFSLSNHNDWDHFLTFMEAEYRSWVLDGDLPLWTYQVCAGSSRVGDPQSFGLSPLFGFVLLFGSFWGAKLIVMFCLGVGLFYSYKIFCKFCPLKREEQDIHWILSACLVFCLFIVGHVYSGHLTFALIPFSFSLIYYFFASFDRRLSHRDCLLLFFYAVAYFSGGFYASLVFFVIPLAMGFLLPFAIFKVLSERHTVKNFLVFLSVIGAALLVTSYKWVSVILYQTWFPRTLTQKSLEPGMSLLDIVLYQTLPTWNHAIVAMPAQSQIYDWYEYASFSPLFLAAVFSILWLFWHKRWRWLSEIKWSHGVLFGTFCFAVWSFLRGDDSVLSLHSIFNTYVYDQSVRVIGRYLYLVQIIVCLLLMFVLRREPELRMVFLRWVRPILGFVIFATLASFVPFLNFQSFRSLQALPSQSERRMTQVQLAPHRTSHREVSAETVNQSSMYPLIRQGLIVPNCYQPLRRERLITTEIKLFNVAPNERGQIPLIESREGGPVSADCSDSVYLTQNKIHFDHDACPTGGCFNINAKNIYGNDPGTFFESAQKYCF